MDGPVFDAMLKTALEEALRRDIQEAPEAPVPSRRQRKGMRGLLGGLCLFRPDCQRLCERMV